MPSKTDPLVVTRTLIKREWADIEPKIAVALASGAVSDGIVNIINAYGVHLPVPVLSGIPLFCALLAGWITPSVGTTTTIRHGDDFVVEKHSGNVEIKTGAIPIQRPTAQVQPTIDVEPYNPPAPANGPIGTIQSRDIPPVQEIPSAPPAEDQKPTQAFTDVVNPGRAQAASFLQTLPSSGGTPAAIHDEPDDATAYTGNKWGN